MSETLEARSPASAERLQPITISILGEPVAFARMRTGAGRHFVPAPQRHSMAQIRMAADVAMRHAGQPPFDEPVSLELLCEFRIPKNLSKKKLAEAITGTLRPQRRPDLDNIYKLAADALSGIVYRDDALVCELRARKKYSLQPKLVITVRAISSSKSDYLETAA